GSPAGILMTTDEHGEDLEGGLLRERPATTGHERRKLDEVWIAARGLEPYSLRSPLVGGVGEGPSDHTCRHCVGPRLQCLNCEDPDVAFGIGKEPGHHPHA